MTPGPTKSDRRRDALLAALDVELRTRRLETISVGELTAAAGVTRSGFYFYFESKQAAVAALLEKVGAEAELSNETLTSGEGPLRRRISHILDRLADAVAESPHVYRALLDARSSDEDLRTSWTEWRSAISRPVAELIRSERASAGVELPGSDPIQLAELLVHLNESTLERLARDPDAPREVLLGTVADMWVRAIVGTVPTALDPHPDSSTESLTTGVTQ